MAHRRMVVDGIKEADAHFVHTLCHLLWSQVQIGPERHEDIGRSALAAGRPVAVLGHFYPAGRNHKSGCCGDIEGVLAVPSGAAGVHQHFVFILSDRNAEHMRAHRPGASGDFLNAFPFHPQGS